MSKYSSQLRRFEFTNILGWSYSRYATFLECKRKYYYQYYGKYDTENTLFQINLLKNLTTVPLEIGNISHKLIQKLLQRLQKTAEEINLGNFFAYAKRETLRICAEKNFEEVYYKRSDAVDFESEVFKKVSQAMQNFLQSGRLQWLFEEALITKDDWLIEFEKEDRFGECRIDNLKAYCKVDFMFPIDEELHIIEWKTGKEDYTKYSVQLRGYAGWANFQFTTDYSLIKTTIAYLLPEYKEMSVELNEYDIDDFINQVKIQTERMYEFCEEPELNVPLEKEKFEMTPAVNFCKTCKYRELCNRG